MLESIRSGISTLYTTIESDIKTGLCFAYLSPSVARVIHVWKSVCQPLIYPIGFGISAGCAITLAEQAVNAFKDKRWCKGVCMLGASAAATSVGMNILARLSLPTGM